MQLAKGLIMEVDVWVTYYISESVLSSRIGSSDGRLAGLSPEWEKSCVLSAALWESYSSLHSPNWLPDTKIHSFPNFSIKS